MAIVRKNVELRPDLEKGIDWRPAIKFMADVILPPIYKTKASGEGYVLGRSEGNKKLDTRRAQNGSYSRSEWNMETINWSSKIWGHEEAIDLIEQAELDDIIDVELVSAEIVVNVLYQSRESRVADAVFNTTLFTGSDYTLAPAHAWDTVDADMRGDFKIAGNAFYKRFGVNMQGLTFVGTGTLLDEMVERLVANDDIKYTQAITLKSQEEQYDALRRYLKLGSITIVDSAFDSTGLGSTAAIFERHWSEDMGMLCILSGNTPTFKTGGLGRQPVFTKFDPRKTVKDYMIESYLDEKVDHKIIRAKEHRGTYVNKEFGFLFKDLLD